MILMRIEEAIGRDPEIMSGELCFAGTRVPVKNLFDHLEADGSLAEFFDGFPRVSRAQVEAVLDLDSLQPGTFRILERPDES